MLGAFFLMGKEINLILVSALLTIAGYSLTDTVVVFDRIRENLKNRARVPANEIINSSINEVLSRTIIVSMTVFFSALSLYLFGGEVIHDFSLAILLGIIVGTYSSVFVASPVVLLWGEKRALGGLKKNSRPPPQMLNSGRRWLVKKTNPEYVGHLLAGGRRLARPRADTDQPRYKGAGGRARLP